MKCFVCGENKWYKKYSILYCCVNCGFTRASNKHFQINSKNLYSKKYFKGIDYADYKTERNALEKNFSDRLKKVLKHKKQGNLLEIGCAYGYFLKLAEKYFDTTGIDLNEDTSNRARENAKKSKVFTGDFQKFKFKEKYDVVVMLDVIEHLTSPHLCLKKIRGILKKDGLLVIETGDIDAVLAKLQGKKWRLITPPMHLCYFSKKTLVELVENNHFQIVSINYPSFTRTIGQIIFRFLKTTQKLIPNFITERQITLNTHDLVFLIATTH